MIKLLSFAAHRYTAKTIKHSTRRENINLESGSCETTCDCKAKRYKEVFRNTFIPLAMQIKSNETETIVSERYTHWLIIN